MACCRRGAELDCAIALDHMILAATNEGLGTCWVGWIERDVIHGILGIPPEVEVPVIVPVGYAAENPRQKPRKVLDELVGDDVFRRF